MFNAGALRNISDLIRRFSKRDFRYHKCLPLRSWKDFKHIPLSGRAELKKFVEGGWGDRPFNITATSGSTSSRLILAHSRKAYEAHLYRLVRLYRQFGVTKSSLCLNLCSYELNSGGRLMDTAFKAAGAGVIPLGPISSPEKIHEAIRLIEILKPTMINAYTNQLFDLFAVLGRAHSIRDCLVNGEPLWPKYQKRIEKMGGVCVHDHYGAMEVSGFAVALNPHNEYMKVIADGLLLEVLKDSGEASATGTGDLLVTDLNNTCMPIIRYRLGDRVEMVSHRGGLLIKVLGRTEDSLLINGVVVIKEELVRTVNDFLGHPHFFFVIDKDPLQYYDKFIINVIKGSSKQYQGLKVAIVQALGIGRGIDIRTYEGVVPRTLNGKIKYFIDARKRA